MAAGKKIASLYAEIGGDSTKLNKSLTDAKGKLGQFKNAITGTISNVTGLTSAQIGWSAAIAAGGKFLSDSINKTVQYADQVRDLSRAIGASAEDSSRFINAADDVFISTEALKTAMTAAIRQGWKPTIENIKIMADEYMALNPGVERSEYLLKRFGRAGQEMGKLLEQGSAGIDKLMAANERLTLSFSDLKAVENYKQQMDALQDSFMGMQIALAKDIIPALSAFMGKISDGLNVVHMITNAQEGYNSTFDDHVAVLNKSGMSQKDYTAEILRSARASNQAARYGKELNASIWAYQDSMETGIPLIGAERDEFYKWMNILGAVSEKERDYAELIESDILPAHKYQAETMERATVAARDFGVGMDDIQLAMGQVKRGYETAAQAQQRLTREMIFAKVSGSMSPDQALKLAEAWGMVDKRTVETTKAINAVNNMFDTNKDGVVDSQEATQYYLDTLIRLEQELNKLDGKTFSANFVLTQTLTGAGVTKYGDKDLMNFKDAQAEKKSGGAAGMSFTVPGGYAGDSYPLGGGRYAQTGETVTVTPVGQKPGTILKNYGTIIVQSADDLGAQLKGWR